VQTLRQRGIRLPQGLVGEDWMVSLWAGRDLQPIAMAEDGRGYVVFAPDAGFAFRSLSPWRLRDYRTYLRRLWRYAQRGVQHEMVWQWLWLRLPESLPPDVQTLYAQAGTPSRLLWTGSALGSLLRCLAVQKVRRVRRGQL
jgi:hypothetical protein